MAIDTLFSACEPRADVLQGTIRESDFAADLAQMAVTTDPDYFEDHPDSLELWSPGSPAFPERVASEDPPTIASLDGLL